MISAEQLLSTGIDQQGEFTYSIFELESTVRRINFYLLLPPLLLHRILLPLQGPANPTKEIHVNSLILAVYGNEVFIHRKAENVDIILHDTKNDIVIMIRGYSVSVVKYAPQGGVLSVTIILLSRQCCNVLKNNNHIILKQVQCTKIIAIPALLPSVLPFLLTTIFSALQPKGKNESLG